MKKIVLILALVAFVGTSCSEKLDVKPPSYITDEGLQQLLQKDPDAALSAMVGNLTKRLYDNSGLNGGNDVRYNSVTSFGLAQNVKGNDLVHIGGGYFGDEYKLIRYREETSQYSDMFWQQYYKWIYDANVILTNITDDMLTNEKTGNLVKGYKAQAMAIRAAAYMYLMWIYADDPIQGTAKVGVPMYLPQEDRSLIWKPADRAASDIVWNLIVNDLETAAGYMADRALDPKAKINDVDLNVINLWLCRAAITTGQWDKVIKAATDIYDAMGGWKLMSETQYVGGIDKLNGFVKKENNTEALFTVDYSQTYHSGTFVGTSFTGWMNTLGGGYGGQGGSYHAIDSRLYDQIDDNDYRKKNFLDADFEYTYIGTGTVESTPVLLRKYYNIKFGSNASVAEKVANYLGDETIMRTSEALLLKAEAEYRSGEEGAARTTLQELASARGAADVTESGDALFKRIQLEWRIEMWGENGCEYYNNKRWGIGVDRSGSANHVEFPTMAYGNGYTWQIPLNEINYNKNLTSQNPL